MLSTAIRSIYTGIQNNLNPTYRPYQDITITNPDVGMTMDFDNVNQYYFHDLKTMLKMNFIFKTVGGS